MRLIPTYTVDPCHQFPPGARTEGASFVVMHVLGVRFAVHLNCLGETHITVDRRLWLVLAGAKVGQKQKWASGQIQNCCFF